MQHHKVRMAKKQFRIGELAKELKVKKFVIRFWEKEFDLASDRSQGGQRYYTQNDLAIFSEIKDLLWNQGFTIAGAKSRLSLEKTDETSVASPLEPAVKIVTKNREAPILSNELKSQIQLLKKQLLALKEQLS